MWNPFKKRQPNPTAEAQSPGDMRTTPVDNPLDYREDGSIRPGDPAYDFLMGVMETGDVAVANQRKDGTWETQEYNSSINSKRGESGRNAENPDPLDKHAPY